MKDLRQFGFLVGGLLIVIEVWPAAFRNESPCIWTLIVGSLLLVPGTAVSQSLKQVHHVWMKIGHVLGVINPRIILGMIYYLLLTPMGLVVCLMGNDSMWRAFA